MADGPRHGEGTISLAQAGHIVTQHLDRRFPDQRRESDKVCQPVIDLPEQGHAVNGLNFTNRGNLLGCKCLGKLSNPVHAGGREQVWVVISHENDVVTTEGVRRLLVSQHIRSPFWKEGGQRLLVPHMAIRQQQTGETQKYPAEKDVPPT